MIEKVKKKQKQKYLILLISIFVIIVILLIGKTYALYQKETEVTFINAKVRWPYANEIIYTTSANSKITNIEQALNDLYEKLGE